MSVKEPEKDAAAAAVPAAEGDEKAEAKGSGSGWELLYCGGTTINTMDRESGRRGNLLSPTRLGPLVGVDIRFVASGCTASHCVALDANGRCFTWGSNEKGQLGHGDTLLHVLPTVVSKLSEHKIIKASVGRNHTVVVTDDNNSFSFGNNEHGQLGLGFRRNEIESSPVPCKVVGATNAVCGADFTIWLSSKKDGSILTAGLCEYGQLGQGAGKELKFDPEPKAIGDSFLDTVVKVACGTNHTVAVDSKGRVYTWGCGESGRLGHGGRDDKWKPCQVSFFMEHKVLPPNAIVSAGSASSACTAGGELYIWGKLTDTDEYSLLPKPVLGLSGWNIRCMASGNLHHIVGTDDTCISWGIGLNGELGYESNGPKSSANPKMVDSLQGMSIRSVGCGSDLSLIVVDKAKFGRRLDQLKTYNGDTSIEVQVQKTVQPQKNETASANNLPANKRGTKYLDESEEDGRRCSKNRGRARGRGRTKKTESPTSRAGRSDGKRGKRRRP